MTRRLAIALAFLTRLPVRTSVVDDADVGRSLAFFPLVGLGLGLLLALAAGQLAAALPSSVTAVLLAGLLALVTGGLHLDGVADTFDALGAQGADRARRLEILRDSRIGAHGAAALVLVLLAKIAALDAVLALDRIATLVAFPVVARWTVVLAVVLFPYARERGLGTVFRAHVRGTDVVVAGVTTLLVALCAGGTAVAAAIVATALALGVAALVAQRLGGTTGDVYGAVVEITEVVFLVLMVAS